MKHTWTKKWIALVCVVSMLMGIPGWQAFAGNETGTGSQSSAIAEVSLTDMGITPGTYDGSKTFDVQKTTAVSLLNAKTSMYISMDASTGSAIYFASPADYWVGLRLRVTADGTLSLEHTSGASVMQGEELDATKVGLTSLLKTKFKLAIEIIQQQEGAKLGLYINDILYDNKYFTVLDNNLGNGFYIAMVGTNDTVTLEEPLAALILPEITLSNMGISAGTYSGVGTFAINKTTDVSLLNAMTSFYITMKATTHSYIDFATYDSWYGLRLRVGENNTLIFEHTDGCIVQEELVPAKAGVTSFFETKMKLSFALYEEDDEVRVRLYFNDKVYDNKYWVVSDPTKLGNCFNIALYEDTDYIIVEEPLSKLTLPQMSLTEFGITEGSYTGEKTFDVKKSTDAALMNKITSMYMTLNASTGSAVTYGVYDDWFGIRLRVADGGKVWLEHTSGGTVLDGEELDPTKVGLTKFIGVRMKVSFALYEANNETRFRLYINDMVYDNKYYVVKDPSKLGNGFTITLNANADTVYLDKVVTPQQPSGPQEPSEPLEDVNLPEVGLADMGIAPGEYDGKGTFAVLKATDVSLMNAKTTMYITWDASKHSYVDFAVYEHWKGLRLRVGDNGAVFFEHTEGAMAGEELDPTKVNLTSFLGTRMKLTFALYEEDEETRVRLYINDILYDNKYWVITDPTKLGDGFNIALYEDADSVILEEAKAAPIPGELTLPKINLEKMGIAPGTYDGVGTFAVKKTTEESLMNAITTMYITLNGSKHSYVNFAVYEYWNGLRLRVGDDGAVFFEHTAGNAVMAGGELDPAKVNLQSFIGTRMKVDFALYEEDDETRVRLYINDILYDNKYWVITDPTKLGNEFNIALSEDADTVILEEAYIVENVMRDYTVLTFTDFGFGATTKLSGNEMLKVKSKETLYNDAIEGYYSFTKDAGYVFFGGQWCGVGLHVNEDGELEVSYANPNVSHTVLGTITSEDIGKALDTKNLLIKTGFVFSHVKDGIADLKVTVRIDDAFERSFNLENVNINTLTERIYIYTDKETTLNIAAAEKDTTEKVTKIPLYQYGVDSKDYAYNKSLVVDGVYEGSLLNTITTMNMTLNADEGTYFQIGGKSGWEGFRFTVMDDGTLALGFTSGGLSGEILTPELAGLDSFFGEEIKVSYKFVESGNDVKFGVYFNGKLYGNRYFVLKNGKAKLGSSFGAYLKNETDTLSLWCEAEVPIPVDFTEFGFTDNWAIELGLKKK